MKSDTVISNFSQYIRTTGLLNAQDMLKLSDYVQIRHFSASEALQLAQLIQQRNVFARHSKENEFYYRGVQKLANKTIIEIFKSGNPDDMSSKAESAADLLEKLAILSTILVLRKQKLLRRLGISSSPKTEIKFIIGPQLNFIRSETRRVNTGQGIEIDQEFCRRFSKTGFPELYNYCLGSNDIQKRVSTSLDWLFESRKEYRLSAAVVKTSIALESLLIFNESESLARSLSERAAFILSDIPGTRQEISRIIKRFYNVRSGIVHGSKKKLRDLSDSLLEGVDRLTLLLYLTIAANSEMWSSVEKLQKWCELEKWSIPSKRLTSYSRTYLTNAIKLSKK